MGQPLLIHPGLLEPGTYRITNEEAVLHSIAKVGHGYTGEVRIILDVEIGGKTYQSNTVIKIRLHKQGSEARP